MKFKSIVLLFFVSISAQASTDEFFTELFRPEKQPSSVISVGGRDTGGTLGPESYSANASIPVSASDGAVWRASALADGNYFGEHLNFPSGRALPTVLSNYGAGLSYNKDLGDSRNIGASVLVDSPSDHPYQSLREVGVQGNLVYKIPAADKNSWIFFLNFSNTRAFLNYVPLPGVAYVWHASDEFIAVIGFPFAAFHYTPSKNLTWTFSYFPPVEVRTRVTYALARPLNVYTEFHWAITAYSIADRSDVKERLFAEEKLAELGIEWPLLGNIVHGLLLDAGGGYSFGRDFFFGERYRDRYNDRIEVGNEAFGYAKLTTRF